MPLTSDWHIHSRNSCDEACLVMAELVDDAAAAGITDFGITDHLHTPHNLPDLEASRVEYDALSPSPRFHFGAEISCVSEWELREIASGRHKDPVYGLRQGGPPGDAPAIGLTAGDVKRLGIEYVVGGTHWPLYVPIEREALIRDYHRQNLFLATHPLVTIVAHPWWWMGHWQDADGMYRTGPWLDDFEIIPSSMHEEFAAALREHGKVAEINLGAMVLSPVYPEPFKRQYVEYLARLQEAGVTLSIGSDCHDRRYRPDLKSAEQILLSAGIDLGRLWRLPLRGARG